MVVLQLYNVRSSFSPLVSTSLCQCSQGSATLFMSLLLACQPSLSYQILNLSRLHRYVSHLLQIHRYTQAYTHFGNYILFKYTFLIGSVCLASTDVYKPKLIFGSCSDCSPISPTTQIFSFKGNSL